MAQDTYFIDKHGVFGGLGSWYIQSFTVYTTSTFVLRTVSDYKSDTAIFTSAQLENFKNNRSFSGFAVFDNSYGTRSVTLSPGTYYVGARNQISGTNSYRFELDKELVLSPTSTHTFSFVDNYIRGNTYVDGRGGKYWHGFTVQSGYRYFLDGCNTGLNTYIIPASSLSAFRSGGSFHHYPSYSGSDNALPGHYELLLPPGSYYLAFANSNSISKPVTYTMERWRETPKVQTPGGSGLDLGGPVSWQVRGSYIRISAAKVSNFNTSGVSGSLRLRVWAIRAPYAGGSLSGYVLGTRRLNQLQAGYYYSDISRFVAFRRPPRGSYYTVMTLEEYTLSGWLIRDYINFSGLTRF